MLAAAWPPLPLGFLALAALVKPLDIISGKPFGRAFRQGYFFSFFFHLLSLYWISWVTLPGMLATVMIISLYPAFIFGLYSSLYRRWRIVGLCLFPFLWVGMEYFRSLFEIAFPWSNLSYTQGSYLPFLQVCSIIGDLGISFIVVSVNLLLWQAWSRRRAVPALAAGLLVVLPTLYGVLVLSRAPESGRGPVRIALLQGDLSISEKWEAESRDLNFAIYDSLTLSAAADSTERRPDLIVWPETAAPAYLLGEYQYLQGIRRTAMAAEVPLVVGTLDYKRLGRDSLFYYNAAIQFDPNGSYRRPYHKSKLVPFAESVPYREYIPWLANLSLGWSDFEPGDSLPVYRNEFGNYGMLICYEVIFPELVNTYIRRGADFLVNITNDTWYGRSSGPYQHAGMAVFRAIENRVHIVRAANSGFSYFVDGYGRIYNRSRLYERTIIAGDISLGRERTIFNRTGPLAGRLGLLSIGLAATLMFGLWIKDRWGS